MIDVSHFKASHSLEVIADALDRAGLTYCRLEDLETAAIFNALRHSGGNRTHAAEALGVNVRTIQRWAKQQGFRPKPLIRSAD